MRHSDLIGNEVLATTIVRTPSVSGTDVEVGAARLTVTVTRTEPT
jgi:hypothetical protein